MVYKDAKFSCGDMSPRMAMFFTHEAGKFKSSVWLEKDEYRVLELMAMKKLIVINRQMVPFTIRRISDFDFLLEMLYSELC